MDISQTEMAKLAMGAIRGNRTAMARLAGSALPKLNESVTDIRAEIEYRRQHEWDVEGARAAAMDPDKTVTPEQTIGALSDLYSAVLRVTAYTPVMLTASGEEAEAIDELWTDAVYSLVLTMHNPVIKYGIIGGLKPELREDAEEYFNHISREVWGTIVTLTEEGDIDATDFPSDTAAIIEDTAQRAPADPEQVDRGGD